MVEIPSHTGMRLSLVLLRFSVSKGNIQGLVHFSDVARGFCYCVHSDNRQLHCSFLSRLHTNFMDHSVAVSSIDVPHFVVSLLEMLRPLRFCETISSSSPLNGGRVPLLTTPKRAVAPDDSIAGF